MNSLSEIVSRGFGSSNVVVLGDPVADQFLSGTISRVSREAPVFILRHDETVTLPGAAANAAANVVALGGRVSLVGFIGDDTSGTELRRSLESAGVDISGLVTSPSTTTTKVRVLAGQHYAARQQVIRIDYEDAGTDDQKVREELKRRFALAAVKADALIISDYGYGSVFSEVFEDARTIADERSIPLIVDSRYRLAEFVGAATATPNREEVEQLLGKDFTTEQCSQLRERLGLTALLVTNGNQGMTLFEAGSAPQHLPAIGPTEPVDVTGAGDTVIAAYALGLASGLSYLDAAMIANHAGGIVVMKNRTSTVSAAELLDSFVSNNIEASLGQAK
ncbi:MAG TPA: PfkB family carbohydrate kinase [Pyrinomonadaceae bacterium]|nr:PfkB family carbohydrate kinase [Pyrinomonadaceae bacterium]